MHRFFCILCFLVLIKNSRGQDWSPKLYFFVTPDSSFVGVKDEHGKIIINPVFSSFFFQDDDFAQPIDTETIEFYSLPYDYQLERSKPATAMGTVYNRSGEFLYHSQLYDNGPDYWQEGVRRYVENGKMGFVDKAGHKITSADWDLVLPFNYGYAEVMEGELTKKYEQGGEHWTIASDGSIVSYLINKNGEQVLGYEQANHPKDYFYEEKYYPYPFDYTEQEERILKDLEVYSFGVSILFNSSYYNYKYVPLQLEITEQPTSFRPYYVVTPYSEQSSVGFDDAIYVDANTHQAWIMDYDGISIPLQEAIRKSMESFVHRENLDISPETRQQVVEELHKIKSHP